MPKVCPVCGATYPDANVFCLADGTTLRAGELDGELIGTVVADRYLVTDLLGEGGMGKVYLARHVRLPQQAAIKVLRRDMVQDPAAVARFNREASNASRIDDEHVARVYDFGETSDGTVYLAMEYVPGRTLRDLVAEGALPPRRAAALVQQIADGLDAAHRLRIIHRDLKPDNVLVVTTADGRDRVKVVDFGIAKAFGADDGKLTKTGFVVGTPEFMSPEQLLGAPLDPRSDVYALALVAYQCLTGTLPFDMTTPERGLTARLTSDPRPLAEVRPAVTWPTPVQAVFDAGLAREPGARTATAGEFARALVRAVDRWIPDATRQETTPIPAMAPPTVPPPASWRAPASRSRRIPIVAAIATVAVLGAGAAFVLRPRTSSRTAQPLPTDSATPSPLRPAPRDTVAPAPTRPATVTPTPPRQPPERPKTAPPPTVDRPTADATAARASLDSLAGVLQGGAVNAATARSVAAAVRALLPRLDAASRTRAQLALIDASVLSGDLAGACSALRAAHASASTPSETAAVGRYDRELGC